MTPKRHFEINWPLKNLNFIELSMGANYIKRWIDSVTCFLQDRGGRQSNSVKILYIVSCFYSQNMTTYVELLALFSHNIVRDVACTTNHKSSILCRNLIIFKLFLSKQKSIFNPNLYFPSTLNIDLIVCRAWVSTGATGVWHPQNFWTVLSGTRWFWQFYYIPLCFTLKIWGFTSDWHYLIGTCSFKFPTQALSVAHTIDCVCSKMLNHGLNHGPLCPDT